MPRITHRDFSAGLWLQGDRDGIPANALRQAKGIAPLRERQIKSRWGSPRVAALEKNASAVVHFADRTMVQVGSTIGFLVGNSFGPLDTRALGGGRIRTARATPSTLTNFQDFPITTDHLFVAGGGLDVNGRVVGNFGARKFDSTLTDTKWGLDPPKGLFLLQKYDPVLIPIVTGGLGLGLWGSVSVIPGTLNTHETGAVGTTNVDGRVELTLVADRNLTFVAVTPIRPVFNAKAFATVDSSEQDWIQIAINIQGDLQTVGSMDIIFDVTAESDAPLTPLEVYSFKGLLDSYSFHVIPADSSLTTDVTGAGDNVALADHKGNVVNLLTIFGTDTNPRDALNAVLNGTLFTTNHKPNPFRALSRTLAADVSQATARKLNTDLGTTQLPAEADSWQLLRIPKQAFHAAGKAIDKNLWGQIRRVYLSLTSTGNGSNPFTGDSSAVIKINQFALHIGTGMMGDYMYALTYKNSRTGSRSNSSDLVKITGVKRQAVLMTGIPIPADLDPQVDTIEVWRTIGNGFILFKAEDIPRVTATATHTDIVADFPGMQDADLRTAFTKPDGSPRPTQFLQTETLTFDNVAVPDSVLDVAGPHLGRLFLLVNEIGARGRCYYTPPGRLEAVQGFVICSSDDDPLVRVILWNGQVYAFSNAKLFEVVGGEQPLTTEVYGVPGTQWPSTVVPTPSGIIYRAKDGLRRFTGSGSELLAPDAVLALFLGESVQLDDDETIAAFDSTTNVVGEYYGGEYWISNGTTTLAVNVETKTWREVGVGAGAMYADPERPLFFLSANSALYEWERPNVLTDGGLALPFVVEIPGTILENQSGATKFVQRFYLDLNTNGQVLTIIVRTLLHGDINLGTIATVGRELREISLLIVGDIVSVELSGMLANRVELFGCAYDYHGTVGSDGSDT